MEYKQANDRDPPLTSVSALMTGSVGYHISMSPQYANVSARAIPPMVHPGVLTTTPSSAQGPHRSNKGRTPGLKPGSTYGALTFISDFLFTDIMNHVEFLKFIITLGKQDDALLVCLLERYAAVADTETLHNPFYSHPEEIGVEHVNLPKNPLRIAISYAELLELKGHSFNIFEFAFLDANQLGETWDEKRMESFGYLWTSLFTCMLQFLVFTSLCYYSIGPDHTAFQEKYGQIVQYKEDSVPIVVIAIGTTLLFCKRAYMQFSEARLFNKVFSLLQIRAGAGARSMLTTEMFVAKRMCLWANTAANQGLAVVIPFFNLYYLLLSETVDDAILNSLALLFILELDEVVLPGWDTERIDDELASNTVLYINKKSKSNKEVIVEKVCTCISPVTIALISLICFL